MRLQKKQISGGILLACCFLISVSAFAFWKAADVAHNVLTLGFYDTELVEEYHVPGSVYPGMTVDKKVNVRNQGTVDAVVRIHFEKAFGTRSESGSFQADSSLDEELIEITCNETYWRQKDDYWYYTEVLRAGEQTKEPLFGSFHVSEKADNRYKGKEAEIVVYMDSVQAEGDALSLWNTTKEELRIAYDLKQPEQMTAVTFHNKTQGFSFSGTESDLFANFKNLVPGCTRTQKIQIRNVSDQNTEMYLYAIITEQDQMDKDDRILLEQILQKDAQIRISEKNELLYEGPVDGNLMSESENMGEQNRIYLGSYLPDSEKELCVELSLSPQTDRSYEALIGRVDWVFCAQGEEENTDDGKIQSVVPKTGDYTPLLKNLLISIVSFLMFCVLFLWRKHIVSRH